jgi:hypothetical protein
MDFPDVATRVFLTDRLTEFRESLEEGTESPVGMLQVTAAILLSDLCRFLGLDEQQHDQVLGEKGAEHVTEFLETRVWLRGSPPTSFLRVD